MTSFRTIICTLDEALHIRRCVENALQLGPVTVVDCGSTDQTTSIATAAGAQVLHHPWEGYAAQKNWALANLSDGVDWVVLLDADEILSAEAIQTLQALRESDAVAYKVARRNRFLGRDLEHVWWYPDYQVRVIKPGRGRFEDRSVHEHVQADGPVGILRGDILHENLNGIGAFFQRHIKYAELEARTMMSVDTGRPAVALPDLRANSRRFIKEHIWYHLPMRGLLRLLWLVLVKRGYKDGREGIMYAQCIATYEVMIDAFRLEFRKQSENR